MSNFDKSKHPMGTVEGKGNRFLPKGSSGTDDNREKIRTAIRRYSDEPAKDIAEYGGTSESKPFIDTQLFSMNYSDYDMKGLRSSLKNHRKQLELHRYKISHPKEYYPNWDSMSEQEKSGRLYQWEKEIHNFQNQIKLIQSEISKRNNYDGN